MERKKPSIAEKKGKMGRLVAIGSVAITVGAYVASYVKLVRDRRRPEGENYGVGTLHPILEFRQWLDNAIGNREGLLGDISRHNEITSYGSVTAKRIHRR